VLILMLRPQRARKILSPRCPSDHLDRLCCTYPCLDRNWKSRTPTLAARVVGEMLGSDRSADPAAAKAALRLPIELEIGYPAAHPSMGATHAR